METDTAGLAEFRQFKEYQAGNVKPNTVYVMNAPVARQTSSGNYPVRSAGNRNDVPVSSGDIPGSTEPVKTEKKKGWSKAAKGAAIGAGSGAVLGAVIHKRNRAVGGVVGGVVGGGVGYGIGRHMDKKDGRY
jgi:outer membrane lipoprotein SlyB